VRLLTIAVVIAFALVGAGCGGDDETSADTDDITIETTTDDTTTDETTTDETSDDDDSGDFDFASGECRDLVDASAQLSQAFGAAGQDADLGDVSELFDEFAANAPDEIRDDFATLAEAYESYAEVFSDIDVDPGETPDAEALAELQEALASIDQAEVTAASERISAWAEENC
jgi:hypothetical protein